jgi:thioredoxin 1
MRPLTLILCTLVLATIASAHQSASTVPFPAFEKWRAAVLAGDSSALNSLYSQSPAPQLVGPGKQPHSVSDEVSFWSSWKSQGLTNISAQIVDQRDQGPDLHVLAVQLSLTTKQGAISKKQFVAISQTWVRQNGQWHIIATQHSAATRLRQPLENKEVYPQNVDAHQEIAEALRAAAANHKRLLVVFGGNWCFDCHVLDEAFHSPEIAPTLNKSFVVVHVDIGQMDKNLDVAKKYDIPLERGVPAIAVLDSDGKLLFSQKRGEFEAARSMAPEDILAFLNKWKPAAYTASHATTSPRSK